MPRQLGPMVHGLDTTFSVSSELRGSNEILDSGKYFGLSSITAESGIGHFVTTMSSVVCVPTAVTATHFQDGHQGEGLRRPELLSQQRRLGDF